MGHDLLGTAVVLRRAATTMRHEIRDRRPGEYDNTGSAARRAVYDAARAIPGNAALIMLVERLQLLYGPDAVPAGELRDVRIPRDQITRDMHALADDIDGGHTTTHDTHAAALEHDLDHIRVALADILRDIDPAAYTHADPDATAKRIVWLLRRALTGRRITITTPRPAPETGVIPA